MKVRLKLLIVFCLLASITSTIVANAQSKPELRYEVSMPEPYTHYFQVSMEVENLEKDYLDFQLPVWAPGSYLVREFAKSIDTFDAYGADGKTLEFEKINKNTWRVFSKNAEKIKVQYNVYAFELSVRTSFLDSSHGYINGSSVFMYVDGYKDLSSTLTVVPNESFSKVTTALANVPGEKFVYSAPNYDILADSPIEIGNQKIFNFEADGTSFTIAMYGDAPYDEDLLVSDMKKVVEACSQVFGSNPNKEYTFIIHNLDHSSGGLEHLNSTTLQVERWQYATKAGMQNFMSLVCHEYFHLWNVKRLRPVELGPFNYNEENYTRLLWVMEGITSYYDEMLLERTGILSKQEYLNRLQGGINRLENKPGAHVQSLADASFDAWIKAYRPNENSYNTTVSYYSKGSIVGAMLDIEIISATNGKKSLDDVMKYLYDTYHLKLDRGITEEDFINAVNKVAGKNMTKFFDDYVYSTTPIDYNGIFSKVGLSLNCIPTNPGSVKLGTSLSASDGKLMVKGVTRGTSAYDSGINANDEIIGVEGYRVDLKILNKILDTKKPGDIVTVTISRDGIIQDLKVKLQEDNVVRCAIEEVVEPSKKAEKIKAAWLK
ncbi:M61 family metallopeptidase [Aureibacter tunicatorum]|uniref:Metalloprotease with PDZ domain n=1 Tax=Aureibacter tunicatorum TaxID=866807 RepID=A0AAE4BTP1_9BACT|nr:PDZ domain-containing protein [Aureibacter tunicatorum]MDR6240896.1 putative metalloprotease with PDZ domain [Aureibacter tunicatorum]BDD03676.1 peptidase M61 [Aureibacter tunicatorum]